MRSSVDCPCLFKNLIPPVPSVHVLFLHFFIVPQEGFMKAFKEK